jgi:hypothetical protein
MKDSFTQSEGGKDRNTIYGHPLECCCCASIFCKNVMAFSRSLSGCIKIGYMLWNSG